MTPWTKTTYRWIALGAVTGTALTGCVVPAGGQAPPTVTVTAEATPAGSEGPTAPPTSKPPTSMPPEPGSPTAPTTSAAPNTPAPTWPKTVKEVTSGIARVQVVTCDSGAVGTGFLVEDDMVVTAAHVVEGATTITTQIDGKLAGAQVMGVNDRSDLALLRLNNASKGHVFTLGKKDPPVGTEVAALGFPFGDDLSFTRGTVSGLNRTVAGNGGTIGNLLQTDTPTNPGNSGGPLITVEGSVAGVVSRGWVERDDTIAAGMEYAVSGPRTAAAVKEWQQRAVPVSAAECEDAAESPVKVQVAIESEHDQAPNIAQSLQLHGQGINDGAYRAAYALFTPKMQQRMGGLDSWREGLASSYWTTLDLVDVSGRGDELTARVRLQTLQDAEDSDDGEQDCSNWTIDYKMHWDGVNWLIDGNRRPSGPPTQCAEFGD